MACTVSLKFQFLQVIIGQFNALINTTVTDTSLFIPLPPNPNIDFDSLTVSNGTEMPRFDAALQQNYYQIDAINNRVEFPQPFNIGQVVIVKYVYYV